MSRIESERIVGDCKGFRVGQVIEVTRKTPMMPTPEPKGSTMDILRQIAAQKQLTPGEAFEIAEVRESAGRTWYRVAGDEERWVNSAALVGQQLRVIG